MSPHKCRKGLCNAFQRIGISFLSLSFFFYVIPVFQYFAGIGNCQFSEYMRMPYYQFFAEFIAYIIEFKIILFFFDLAVKNDLQQNIAQFLTKQSSIVKVYSFYSFVNLFNKIIFY